MEKDQQEPMSATLWQKTNFANLIRYVPSGNYFARMRVRGKLIRQSLKTDVLSGAKLRSADLEKAERQAAGRQEKAAEEKMSFADAADIFRA